MVMFHGFVKVLSVIRWVVLSKPLLYCCLGFCHHVHDCGPLWEPMVVAAVECAYLLLALSYAVEISARH